MDSLSSIKEQKVIDKLRLPILAFLLKPLVLGTLVYLAGGWGLREEDRSKEPVLSFQTSLVTTSFVKQVAENH